MSPPDEILDLETARNAALVGADVPVLTALFSEDATWIHSSGRADDRTRLLELIGSGQIQFTAIRPADVSVRMRPSVAIVNGTVQVEALIAGAPRQMHNRFSVVWAREADGWRVLHWQSTALATH